MMKSQNLCVSTLATWDVGGLYWWQRKAHVRALFEGVIEIRLLTVFVLLTHHCCSTFTPMPTTRTKRRAGVVASQSKTAQATIPTVDEIVHDQVFYAKLCEEQSAVFRQNIAESDNEFALYAQSAGVVKPGQNWKPAACDRDAFVAEMKKRCQEVPNSIAEQAFSSHILFLY